ncbi:hypothetical protein [Klebsiella pneumoniae]|uniref:hypothetical protein n=1 Tax=Klebsiella pneumoniae TaxID=573 RepID=UPI002159AC4E
MTITLQAVNELIASLESAGELSIRETKVMALAKAYQQLAAENVALKSYRDTLDEIKSSLVGGGHGHMAKADMQAQSAVLDVIFDAFDDIETPATDRIVAGIKADGRAEGINFAASRLAAAFNHGFVDKPMAEVGDVVRMILTAKEDLAKDPVLAADGLSGEYAEKSLAEWEAALSDGASYD